MDKEYYNFNKTYGLIQLEINHNMWLKLTRNFLICASRNCRFRKMKRADSVNREFTQWNA